MHALWSTDEQWSLLLPVLLALVLSTAIGLEREVDNKQAGLRTHTLVGVGSAVFMLVSKYGFADLLNTDHVALDPSRIAAQIVSGIGFVGGGLIFVRRDAVRGLTTAATVWLAAAVGVACGAGLPVLAVATTVGLIVITRGFPPLSRFVARHRREPPILRLSYSDGHGVLRNVLAGCTERGWVVHQVAVDRETVSEEGQRIAVVTLRLQGRGDLAELTAELAELPGVRSTATGADDPLED
ncbi:MgtC/SapB family protein [Amycolatopsis sp. NPDC023774]|uniref:MgtC/SapB family protein n=1 Tax=Amycolatopsis sp. NPDC023774 TaxID=3155015 RepID=UPI0033CFD5AF